MLSMEESSANRIDELSQNVSGSPFSEARDLDSRFRLSLSPKAEHNYVKDILNEKELLLLEQIKMQSHAATATAKKARTLEQPLKTNRLAQGHGDKTSEVRLYRNALERMENRKMVEELGARHAKSEAVKPKLSKGSYRIMARRVEDSLQKALGEVDCGDSRAIKYEQLGRILTLLEVFRVLEYSQQFEVVNHHGHYSENCIKRRVQEMNLHESFWAVATGHSEAGQADIEPVYLVLKILMDPSPAALAKRAEGIVSVLVGYWEHQMQEEECYDRISAQSVVNLVRLYTELQKDRLAFEKIGYFKAHKFSEIIQEEKAKFTFKPQLAAEEPEEGPENENEEDWPEDKQPSRILQLIESKKERDAKIEKLRKEKEQRELDSCTFQPNSTKNKARSTSSKYEPGLVDRLYNYEYIKEKVERESIAKHERQLEELEKCTFQPNFRKNRTTRCEDRADAVQGISGYEKAVGRLRYASDLQKLKKYQKEHIPTGQNYKGPGYKIAAPSFVGREKRKREPYMSVEVNMGNGKVGRIDIREGDCPGELAKNFCKIYGLGPGVRKDIEELLEEHISQQQEQSEGEQFPE